MKKLLVAAFAAVLAVAFVVPASALENQFHGYWRTRAFTNQDFSGTGSEAMDRTIVDTRTRLYWTAQINDNLKLVNKFEFNSTWGDNNGGDIGSDGVGHFRVKHSYADFNWMDTNFKIGQQPLALHRGFLFDDDFSGVTISKKMDDLTLTFVWAKVDEGHVDFAGADDANDFDMDMYVFYPSYDLGNGMVVKALLGYLSQDKDANRDETDAFFVGVDFDASFDAGSVWFTAIYETGDYSDVDVDAFLVALGGKYDFGDFDVHGQAFYASGEDKEDEIDYFGRTPGQSYYWAEIMGLGTFDASASAGAPGDKISNIIAVNVGAAFKPMDKLSLSADLWYAQLQEDNAAGDDDLGVEVDLKATYQLVEGLNLDVVAAYLFAGDATGNGDEDPYEIGTRLSLSF